MSTTTEQRKRLRHAADAFLAVLRDTCADRSDERVHNAWHAVTELRNEVRHIPCGCDTTPPADDSPGLFP